MKMKSNCWLLAGVLSFALAISAMAQNQQIKIDSETISGLGARNIGSAAMSGRIATLDAVQEGQRLTIYVGAASGGVWKSVNGGTTFKKVCRVDLKKIGYLYELEFSSPIPYFE